MRARPLSERDRLTIKWGGAAVLAIVLYVFVVAPVSDRYSQVQSSLRRKERECASLDNAQKQHTEAKRTEQALWRYVGHRRPGETYEQQIPKVLDQLEGFASLTQVTVTRVEPLPVQDNGHYAKCSIVLTCEATLDQLAEYLYNMHTSSPVMVVERFEVSGAQKPGARLRAQVLVTSYCVADQPVKPAEPPAKSAGAGEAT